jgi:hypothetical protein
VRDEWFSGLSVAPIGVGDEARFDALLDEYHWLGHRTVGETMRYAATDSSSEWVALLGFASRHCRVNLATGSLAGRERPRRQQGVARHVARLLANRQRAPGNHVIDRVGGKVVTAA